MLRWGYLCSLWMPRLVCTLPSLHLVSVVWYCHPYIPRYFLYLFVHFLNAASILKEVSVPLWPINCVMCLSMDSVWMSLFTVPSTRVRYACPWILHNDIMYIKGMCFCWLTLCGCHMPGITNTRWSVQDKYMNFLWGYMYVPMDSLRIIP